MGIDQCSLTSCHSHASLNVLSKVKVLKAAGSLVLSTFYQDWPTQNAEKKAGGIFHCLLRSVGMNKGSLGR